MRFSYSVNAEIELTLREVEHLLRLSSVHYDETCQSAGRVGGFIYGWSNRQMFLCEEGSPMRVFAKSYELDTCLKILEHPKADALLRKKLKTAFDALMEEHVRVNGLETEKEHDNSCKGK